MSELMWVNVGLIVLNVVMLLALGWVYGRTWREVRSNFTLGLLLFAVFLLLHNAIVLWHLLTMMPVFATLGEALLLLENALQAVALGFLLYSAWK